MLRNVEIIVNHYWQDKLGIPEKTTGFCHGFFQFAESNGDAFPTAIIELTDGRILYVDPEKMRFIDVEEVL